jgi:hypothetical protein
MFNLCTAHVEVFMVYAHNSASEDQWLNSDTTAAHSEPDPMGIPQLAESKDGKKASRDIVMFSTTRRAGFPWPSTLGDMQQVSQLGG